METSSGSWGRFPKVHHKAILSPATADLPQVLSAATGPVLPYGKGRSYGDSCLNASGVLVSSENMQELITLDETAGVLTAQAGMTFDAILQYCVPRGWFLPVTPGTKFVTVGGAIANDVHGKNHHCDGTFGGHVLSFELLRSSGERLMCSPTENPEYFKATIGGLGLTGFITQATFRLKKIASSSILQKLRPFKNLEEYFSISEEEKSMPYTMAWVDGLNGSEVRGIHMSGQHEESGALKVHSTSSLSVPFDVPDFVLGPLSMKIFNHVYYWKGLVSSENSVVPYEPFFFPLDAILHWNRLYGKKGFLQYQCVVPFGASGQQALKEIFTIIKKSQQGSFLAVLKNFGAIASPGMLSFPRPGVTLALDFSLHDKRVFDVLSRCDEVVQSVRGAVYPAKDARMSAEMFQSSFPRLAEFKKYVDPNLSSSFWRRVNPS